MKQELQERWDEILNYMKKEYNISDVSFKTWLKKLNVYDVNENIITVVIEDNQMGDNALSFIRNRFGLFLKTAIAELTNEEYEINFVLRSYVAELEKKEKKEEKEETGDKTGLLNHKYTFDNFVVGDNNNTAQAASIAVAEAPGESEFNPLYIYGGAGLGKTHLMYAIANYLAEHRPDLKILFVSSEKFTHDLVESIRAGAGAPEEFRKRYRSNDVLLIDDIQFIIGKERTQEEFFHTFNEMRESNRQIVISSDKPPRDMQILDERLKSRFQSGYSVDIQPPAYETRLAILNKKASINNYNISPDILEYIAKNIKSNIRQLEGALTKVYAMGRLQKREINLELATEALKDMLSPEEKKVITPELVVNVVSEHYNLTSSMIFSQNRSKEVAYPRQICMYLCKLLTSCSLGEIGKYLGNRDHTTILHGCKKVSTDMEKDPVIKETVELLIKKLNPSD